MTKREVAKAADGRKAAAWRTVLPIHSAAAAYPRMSRVELVNLAADIKTRGLQLNIVLFHDGKRVWLLDGISRLDALEAAGFNLVKDGKLDPTLGLGGGDCTRTVVGVDPVATVDSLNLHRRHLTPEQKRERIAQLVKADPTKSDRTIAKAAKADHKTVAAVRANKEATGEIPQLKKRTGADGKIRRASRIRTSTRSATPKIGKGAVNAIAKAAEAVTEKRETAARQQQDVGPQSSPEVARQLERLAELENTTRLQASKIIGLESEVADLKAAGDSDRLLERACEVLETFFRSAGSSQSDIEHYLGTSLFAYWGQRRAVREARRRRTAKGKETVTIRDMSKPAPAPVAVKPAAPAPDDDPFEIPAMCDRTTRH